MQLLSIPLKPLMRYRTAEPHLCTRYSRHSRIQERRNLRRAPWANIQRRTHSPEGQVYQSSTALQDGKAMGYCSQATSLLWSDSDLSLVASRVSYALSRRALSWGGFTSWPIPRCLRMQRRNPGYGSSNREDHARSTDARWRRHVSCLEGDV